MNNNYRFNNLIEDILCNREVEFDFNKNNYSITNLERYWYFYDEANNKNIKICKFEETDILIGFIKRLCIDNIYLEDIFDENLYTDLYVFWL